jgi:hypothetical protein
MCVRYGFVVKIEPREKYEWTGGKVDGQTTRTKCIRVKATTAQ